MKPNTWKKLDSKIIHKTRWIQLREDLLVTERGEEKEFAIVTFPFGSSVLPIDPDGNVYLVKQYRPGGR